MRHELSGMTATTFTSARDYPDSINFHFVICSACISADEINVADNYNAVHRSIYPTCIKSSRPIILDTRPIVICSNGNSLQVTIFFGNGYFRFYI